MAEVERLTTGDLSEVLAQVAPAIGRGGVNVLSVAAIRDHSPERWPRKHEQVHAFLERAFIRASSPDAFIAPLNAVEFVAVQPSRSRSAALGFSANVLRETLQFFLGAAVRADMRLFQVTDVVDGALTVEPVDIAPWDDEQIAPDLSLGAASGQDAGRYQAAAVAALSTAVLPRGALCWRFGTPGGAMPTVATGLAPVWNVRSHAITSFLIEAQALEVNSDGPPMRRPTATLPSVQAGEVALRALMAAEEGLGDEPSRARVGQRATPPPNRPPHWAAGRCRPVSGSTAGRFALWALRPGARASGTPAKGRRGQIAERTVDAIACFRRAPLIGLAMWQSTPAAMAAATS